MQLGACSGMEVFASGKKMLHWGWRVSRKCNMIVSVVAANENKWHCTVTPSTQLSTDQMICYGYS